MTDLLDATREPQAAGSPSAVEADADAPVAPLTKREATLPAVVLVLGTAGLIALWLGAGDLAPNQWLGGAIATGLTLLDALATGMLLPSRLRDAAPNRFLRFLVVGFFSRAVLIVGLGLAILPRYDRDLGMAFILVVMLLHFALLTGLYVGVNRWLNRRLAFLATLPPVPPSGTGDR